MSYAWLKYHSSFFDPSWATIGLENADPLFWRDDGKFAKFCERELVVNSDLEGALERGNEILFTRTGRSHQVDGDFLLVPVSLENRLLRLLKIVPYGQERPVIIAEPSSSVGEVSARATRSTNGMKICTCPDGRKYCQKCLSSPM